MLGKTVATSVGLTVNPPHGQQEGRDDWHYVTNASVMQCCGAATFLGGSGSDRPRSAQTSAKRGRLRLQAKVRIWLQTLKLFMLSSEKMNYYRK